MAGKNSDAPEGGVELTDLIRDVRKALTDAMHSGGQDGDDEMKFELGPVDLELEFVVEKSHKPGVSARLFVVDVDYAHERSKTYTNRIKLNMQPRLLNQPLKRPVIHGKVVPGEK